MSDLETLQYLRNLSMTPWLWPPGMEGSGASREEQLDFVNEIMADVRGRQMADSSARPCAAREPAELGAAVRDQAEPEVIRRAREQMLNIGPHCLANQPSVKSANQVSCSQHVHPPLAACLALLIDTSSLATTMRPGRAAQCQVSEKAFIEPHLGECRTC